jgi:hypothetical protein
MQHREQIMCRTAKISPESHLAQPQQPIAGSMLRKFVRRIAPEVERSKRFR